jgi:hypothetical protein
MFFNSYIDTIKRQFIDRFGFPENPAKPGCVLGTVPDGTYRLEIDGKTDYVVINDGNIYCCNFEKPDGIIVEPSK